MFEEKIATSNFSYVYVLSSSKHIKIGNQSHQNKERYLSTTGVHKKSFQIKIKDAESNEFKTHKIFNNFRVKNNRAIF